MVNITKRMHKLMPKLWRVKGGAGAAILPPKPPAPQLTSVTLRIPNPCNGYDYGAHSFWRNFLPALRYHNLTLPIKVEQKLEATPQDLPTLTLQFEATTRAALENQNTTPRYSDIESLQKWREELQTKRRIQKDAELTGGPVIKKGKSSWVDELRKQQDEIGVPTQFSTSAGAISTKPQAPADPSAPSTTSPPTEMYQRTVTLGLRGRYALDIWRWFQGVTGARPYKLNSDERRLIRKQERFEVRSKEDRDRVKAGLDAMKKEQAELKRAREAAERLSAMAV